MNVGELLRREVMRAFRPFLIAQTDVNLAATVRAVYVMTDAMD